jgi:hypothetical protein
VVVTVRGTRERSVICRRRWENELLHAADWARQRHPDGYLFRPALARRGKNTVGALVARAHRDPCLVAFNQGRLRIGWMVELIQQPVPLNVLAAAAGLSSLRSLSRILRHVRTCDADTAAELLRGAW